MVGKANPRCQNDTEAAPRCANLENLRKAMGSHETGVDMSGATKEFLFSTGLQMFSVSNFTSYTG